MPLFGHSHSQGGRARLVYCICETATFLVFCKRPQISEPIYHPASHSVGTCVHVCVCVPRRRWPVYLWISLSWLACGHHRALLGVRCGRNKQPSVLRRHCTPPAPPDVILGRPQAVARCICAFSAVYFARRKHSHSCVTHPILHPGVQGVCSGDGKPAAVYFARTGIILV